MRKGVQLKALLLLGIFSLILVHQVVPHHHHDRDHHSHDSVAHSHTGLDHGHHHHEHNNEEEKELNKNLLNLLVEIHSHGTFLTVEHLPAYTIVKQHKSIDLKVVRSIDIISNIEFRDFKSDNKLQLYSLPDIAYKAHLVRPELRGPPILS